MKRLLKPACIAFYFLTLLVFFLAGLSYAGVIDAGKNQGLAGGAIVLGYGVLFGGIAFIASFFIAYHIKHRFLVKLNWILLVILFVSYGFAHYRFKKRQSKKKEPVQELKKKPTKTTDSNINFILC